MLFILLSEITEILRFKWAHKTVIRNLKCAVEYYFFFNTWEIKKIYIYIDLEHTRGTSNISICIIYTCDRLVYIFIACLARIYIGLLYRRAARVPEIKRSISRFSYKLFVGSMSPFHPNWITLHCSRFWSRNGLPI